MSEAIDLVSAHPRRPRLGSALLWLTLDVFGGQAIPFIAFLLIARVIGPEEYGAFALAMACIGLLTIVLYQGLAEGLIRLENPTHEQLSTGFWLNMLIALGIVVAAQVGAPFIAALYHAPEMADMLRWLSLLAPLQALASVQTALFRHSLKTATLARRTLIGRTSGAVAGVLCAWLGFGIWSLVVLQIVQSAVSTAILWIASPWRPGFVISRAYALELMRFGSRFMGATFVTALVGVIDSLVVGLFFDPAVVGFYMLASRLLDMAVTLMLVPMHLLIMPVLSRAAHAPAQFASSYERILTTVHMAWMPFVLLLGLLVDPFLPIVFGSKWAGATPLVQAMCLTAFTTPLWFFSGQALSAANRPDLYLRLSLFQIAITGACVLAGSQFGIVPVAFAWALSSAIMAPIAFSVLASQKLVAWREVITPAAKLTVAGLGLVAASVASMQLLATISPNAILVTAAGAAIGVLFYLGLIELVLFRGRISGHLKDLASLVAARRSSDLGR